MKKRKLEFSMLVRVVFGMLGIFQLFIGISMGGSLSVVPIVSGSITLALAFKEVFDDIAD